MAKDVLSVPAAGVGVERLFNTARDIVTYRRHQLDTSTIRELMLLRHFNRLQPVLDEPLEGEQGSLEVEIERAQSWINDKTLDLQNISDGEDDIQDQQVQIVGQEELRSERLPTTAVGRRGRTTGQLRGGLGQLQDYRQQEGVHTDVNYRRERRETARRHITTLSDEDSEEDRQANAVQQAREEEDEVALLELPQQLPMTTYQRFLRDLRTRDRHVAL